MTNDYYIHPSTVVEDAVHISKDTKIFQFSHVMSHCIIGENCTIGRNVTIETGVIIKNNVIIENNCVIRPGVIIEDNVIVGASTVFANTPTLKPRSIKPKASDMATTVVRAGANIGPNSTIICGYTIGTCSVIGAGSVIADIVPDYSFMVGNPAKNSGWVCQCGNKLTFKDCEALCIFCHSAYKIYKGSVTKLD